MTTTAGGKFNLEEVDELQGVGDMATGLRQDDAGGRQPACLRPALSRLDARALLAEAGDVPILLH